VTYLQEKDRGATAARSTRERLGLGLEAPIVDVVEVLEEFGGVPVTVLELPASVAGVYGRRQGHSFVFVNGLQAHAAGRQRFTVVHEYGHAVLGHEGGLDYIRDMFGSVGKQSPREIQADGFAAEFLAPIAGVRGWLMRVGEPDISLETVVRLACFFHVSAEAALYRLQSALRLPNVAVQPLKAAIDADEHKSVAKRLGLKEHEDTLSRAAGDNLPRFPRATVNQAATAYERGLLKVDQIAALLEVGADKVRAELNERGATPPEEEPDY
jgi:Zn-dependent peptidase ImmA (M78 family)